MVRRARGGTKVSVNFKGVRTQKRIPEGAYRAKLVEVTKEKSAGKDDYLAWTFECIEGEHKGYTWPPYSTSLQPQALWNLRGVLEACGLETEDGEMDIDIKTLADEADEVVVESFDDTYEGRKRSKIGGVLSLEDADMEPGEGGGAEDNGGGDADLNEIDLDDLKEMDAEDLKELCEEYGIKVKLTGTVAKQRKAVKEAIEAALEDDKGKSEAEGVGDVNELDADEVADMSAEELEEIVEEYGLDVELEGTLRKKRTAVKKAIEAAQEDAGGGGEGDEGNLTEDDVKEMSKEDLAELVKEEELDVKLTGPIARQRRAVVKAMKDGGYFEE